MFFTKHDSKECPNCSFHKAHVKRTPAKMDLNCYYCGFSLIKEKNLPVIEDKKELIVFTSTEEILQEERDIISSDIEWFMNEYLFEGKDYIDLSGYELFFYRKNQINIQELLNDVKNKDYHYVVLLNEEKQSYECLSIGEKMKNKLIF